MTTHDAGDEAKADEMMRLLVLSEKIEAVLGACPAADAFAACALFIAIHVANNLPPSRRADALRQVAEQLTGETARFADHLVDSLRDPAPAAPAVH